MRSDKKLSTFDNIIGGIIDTISCLFGGAFLGVFFGWLLFWWVSLWFTTNAEIESILFALTLGMAIGGGLVNWIHHITDKR